MSTQWGRKYKWYIVPTILIPCAALAFHMAEPTWTLYVIALPFVTAFAEMRGCPALYRRACMICDVGWFVLGVSVGSIGIILTCLFSVTSCLISIVRFEYPELYARLTASVLLPSRQKQYSAAE